MTSPTGTAFTVIPARGGSKGIPGKNLRMIGGVPLVARAVAAALEAKVGGVAVSTDDEEIADVSRRWGAEVIQRPQAISTDTAPSEAVLVHALDTLAAEGREPEILIFLQCTSPFFSAADIRAVVEKVRDHGFESAFSATPDHGFLWRERPDGCAEGINHDETAPRMRRQDLAPQYRENGAIYAMRVDAFRRVGRRFCGRTALVACDIPIVEIDGPDDLLVADALAATRPGR